VGKKNQKKEKNGIPFDGCSGNQSHMLSKGGRNGILADWMTRNKNVAHNEIVNRTVVWALCSLFSLYIFTPENLSFAKPITWIYQKQEAKNKRTIKGSLVNAIKAA